ncbi:MAG TPA: PhzF family phenazine biosynthesis protein [Candidatus Baltobacteraceae bacterium]|nr:PhzF family phenazine biosynthesis protein [Candidatus Baltobacteraceae bacterium]
MARVPYFEVDAFASKLFSGNPAGICPLAKWLDDALMQNIAAENNLAETAFFVPHGDDYDLRWFTPTVEIDLCGHATLASAFIIFSELGFRGNAVHFHSKSGRLTVSRNSNILTLDFPSRPPAPCNAPDALVKGLGMQPAETLKARDYFCVFADAEGVRSLQPDFGLLGTLDEKVIVTAPGTDCDFVSRFFAPTASVNEDPVTGSAHCTLIPYWSKRFGKTKLYARQLSKRGGELFCEDAGERVRIGGNAVLYSRGEIELPNIRT